MKAISIAQEHFCSAATQVVTSQLLPAGARRRALRARRRRRVRQGRSA